MCAGVVEVYLLVFVVDYYVMECVLSVGVTIESIHYSRKVHMNYQRIIVDCI